MKKIENFEAKKSVMVGEQIPAGGYVSKILGTRMEQYKWGKVLVISYDIAEGNYKDYFQNEYENNTFENKKYKGNYRIIVPDERSQWYEFQKRTFENAIWAIEDSNQGFRWDWDETKLKGKVVGVLIREKEWEYNGKEGVTTEACTLISADDVRKNRFKIPKIKKLKKSQQPDQISNENPVFEKIEDDDDIPF